jgi:hypothetical protein
MAAGRDRELEFIEFHRAWIKATEQPFDSRKPLPRALRFLAAVAFGLRLPNAVRKPRKVRFPESSPDPERDALERLLARAKNDGEVRAKAQPHPQVQPPQPQPQPRGQRRPSVARLIKRAEKEGKSVTSITMPDGTVLHFGEPQPTEASNPWLADLDKVTKK